MNGIKKFEGEGGDRNMSGKTAKDVISGFRGVVVGFLQFVSGCNQYCIVPPVDKDGKYITGEWFDVQRVIEIPDAPAVELHPSGPAGADNTPKPDRPQHS